MGIFTRKKKQGATTEFKLLNSIKLPFIPFGDNITKSDVVMICIDRVASQCAKLKARYIKQDQNGVETEKTGDLSFILRNKPNEVMTPYQFLYKTVTLLLRNDNAFIYPKYNMRTLKIEALYPLNPIVVEPIVDSGNNYYLKFYFEDGTNYVLPYENVIHLKRFYGKNDIFGGSSSTGDHDALLKTVRINDSLLQGVESAMLSSFQIKGILKLNGLLNKEDKEKQIGEFNKAIGTAVSKKSSVIPMDLKSEYKPLSVDPKMIDQPTLDFVQSKILDYYGVSSAIFASKYTEEEYNSFYESTIEPIAIQLSDAFSLCLLTDNELKRGEEIRFFSERLQYASWNTKVGAIEKLMGLGIMSLNESRNLLGLEPVEGGNKRLQSLNYVDASKANKYQVGESDTSQTEPKEEPKIDESKD